MKIRAGFFCCLLGSCLASAELAASTAAERTRFLAAERALAQGELQEYRLLAAGLRDYPLYPYLEFSLLPNDLGKVEPQRVRGLLERHADTPLAKRLRSNWLSHLAGRQRWQDYLAFYVAPGSSTDERCNYLTALLRTGQRDQALEQTEPLWLHGHSQPKSCDAALDAWRAAGRLTGTLVWRRVALAMDAGDTRFAKYLGRFLSQTDQAWLDRWLALHAKPQQARDHQQFAAKHDYREAMLAYAVERLARSDTEGALRLWRELEPRYAFSADQRYAVERRIAGGLVRATDAAAMAFLDKLRPRADDERLQETRLRAALFREDWEALLRWLDELPETARNDERWSYWRARALDATGRKTEAAALYLRVAQERSYYGFLAADRARVPYHLAHSQPPVAPAELQRLGALGGVARARELHALERWVEARREWRDVTSDMSKEDLMGAAELAESWGWHDQAIFTLARSGYWEDLELRFPILHRNTVATNAGKHDLEPAWVFAVMRQESAFMRDARSPVGARGLMQLMPATAKHVATKSLKRKAPQLEELFDPGTNIGLGTAYLREVLDELGDHPVLATAAYNAGPHRVKRWLPERELDADVWVELVPFNETRGYLRRVLSYTVIYEQRLGLQPTRLSARMQPVANAAKLLAREARTSADRT